MGEKLHRITAFAKYYWRAKTKYDVHSPFVFDFIQNVLEEPKWYYSFDDIQKIRYQLLASKESVAVTDFGAGSQVISTKTRKVKDIAASSLSHPFFCQILFSMVNWLSPKNVLELGTSLGIATLHLAKAKNQTNIVTLEGCPNIAQLAQQNVDLLGAKNVSIIVGDFENTLLPTLQQLPDIQLVILDGNHQKDATLRYFEQILAHATDDACFIFDDIYWSKGMTEAWEMIKKHPRVTLSIDLFQYGLIFLRKEQKEIEHFTLIPAYCKPWSMGFF